MPANPKTDKLEGFDALTARRCAHNAVIEDARIGDHAVWHSYRGSDETATVAGRHPLVTADTEQTRSWIILCQEPRRGHGPQLLHSHGTPTIELQG